MNQNDLMIDDTNANSQYIYIYICVCKYKYKYIVILNMYIKEAVAQRHNCQCMRWMLDWVASQRHWAGSSGRGVAMPSPFRGVLFLLEQLGWFKILLTLGSNQYISCLYICL